MRAALVAFALAACAGGAGRGGAGQGDELAARFPLARLTDRALCDALLARPAEARHVFVDPEPRLRRKVIVSDLHLGPGTTDPRFAGLEDFYSDAEWAAFLERQAAAGPTDLVIDGDFLELWQIAAALGVLPRKDDPVQPASGPVLAADQDFAVAAVALVIRAHPAVFRALGDLLARGDHRVIVLAGNHDADLLWPKVQLAIARAIRPHDPARLVFVDAAAYEHGGVHIEHGHAYDAANRFASNDAPFGRDRAGGCRLQSSWGEIFVDRFYTETEREIPFIDNLYPESAAVLWAVREDKRPDRNLAAALRFLELVRSAEPGALNRDAAGAILQGVLGSPGAHGHGPESLAEVVDHISDELVDGNASGPALVDAAFRLRSDPDLATLWQAVGRAAGKLPDVGDALAELRTIDPASLSHLRDLLLGDPMTTAAKRILAGNDALRVVVFGHTHQPGGAVLPIELHGHRGYYANTGSWISVASVADLRARGITWDRLSLADRTTFASKRTAVIVEYDAGVPRAPVVVNAR